MDENHEGKQQANRRDFLKLAGLSTVSGGAALVASTSAKADELELEVKNGYRETDHVKTYYDLARF